MGGGSCLLSRAHRVKDGFHLLSSAGLLDAFVGVRPTHSFGAPIFITTTMLRSQCCCLKNVRQTMGLRNERSFHRLIYAELQLSCKYVSLQIGTTFGDKYELWTTSTSVLLLQKKK